MKRPLLVGALALMVISFVPLATSAAVHYSDTTDTNLSPAHATSLVYRKFEGLAIGQPSRSLDPIEVDAQSKPDTVAEKRERAHALLQKVLQAQRFLEGLDALSEIELPVGIVKSGGGVDYTILIDRLQFTKEGALMDVYVSLALPQTGGRIAFHGVVPLSAKGGIAGTAKVYLLGDHLFRFNSTTQLTIRGTDRSYVEFDCSGFLGVNLDAELQFSTDFIVPEDEQGNPKHERLSVYFTTYTQTLHDILVTISLPPFQIKNLPGFGFHVTNAYLDWSDITNPDGIIFPERYTSSVVDAGLAELWQGIYLQELEVRLPQAFTRQNQNRVGIGAREMIVDHQGLTGSLYAENILEDGDMNGWSYSLDRIGLELVTSHVAGFSVEGKLSIPVVKGADGTPTHFNYVAHRGAEGNYIFSVTVDDQLKLDLWLADIKLSKGSSVIVTEKQNQFFPSAHLNGELTINISGKGPKAKFNSVRFEDMVINSEAPYFTPGTFGLGSADHHSSVSKYPIVFDNITLKSEDKRVGISFDLMINIGGKPEDESFAGKAGLVVWGIQDDEPARDSDGKVMRLDRYSWKFDKIELTSVKINIKKPKVIELAGEVRFYDDDPTYGEGFKGSLRGTIHTIKVEAQALFGKTEQFRYWYADALVELKTGIPIVPGVLSAFGFGGGYYSKMKQSPVPVASTIGKSPSGITYVPDENTIGIRAIVLIGTPRPEAMKGDVALEVSLNRHGGINSVTFTGNANFMSTASLASDQIRQLAAAAVSGNLTEKLGSVSRGQVYGSVKLHFDNINDVFHGNLEIYVNVAGGMVRGVSEANKAGWAVLHFERNDWYIHIGTPDQPLGLEVARIFRSKSYFMLGKNLPGSPPPPEQVSEILGNVDLDYMRDLNALESGMGIAFGLHFLVDTGDLRFLMFYGRFSAGTGLDFMLKDYGNEYHCAGSSGAMGINGWYANGQAYAFVMGKIGIKVNLKFYKGTYDILNIGAAAVLQAKGPNPFWMKGTVGGYYKILGGLVKGRCRFEVTVGKECKPVAEQNLLEDVKIIAGITPASASVDVDVFNTPQVAFNIPVGEIFEITDVDQGKHYFRAVLDEFGVFDGTRRVDGKLIWNADKDVVVFDGSDLLPGQKKLKARATISFEQKRNETWTKVRFDGKIVSETIESAFTTGTAPAFIPESNIEYSYPLVNQMNFHPKELEIGLIKLRDGQPYLFKPDPDWIKRIRMTEDATGQYVEADLSYNTRTREVNFTIPKGLRNSTVYRFEIINSPKHHTTVDHNVQSVESEISMDASAGSATLTTQSLNGNLEMTDDQAIFKTSLRTSKYNTFIDKMKSITLAPTIRVSSGINIFQLTAILQGDESFETAELYHPALGKPGLIQMEAILDGNRWYEKEAYPLVYEGYPLLGWMRVRRPQPEILGIPPVRDVYVANVREPQFHEQSLADVFTNEYVVFNLGQSVASDYFDMQRHAVNLLVDKPSDVTPRLATLIVKPLPYVRSGAYRIRFTYIVPGINKRTSSYEINLFNRIPDND